MKGLRKPIRVFYSPTTGRFYATRAYREVGPGEAKVTGEKFDVTNDIAAVVLRYGLTFSKVEEAGDASP